MKKTLKHLPGLIILAVAILAILDFSLRADPIPVEDNHMNIVKANQEDLEGKSVEKRKKEAEGEGGQIPMEPVHLKLFPVNGYLSHSGDLFAEGSYMEKNGYTILMDPIQAPILPLNVVEENQFNYFLDLVKIEENKSFQEIISSTKKKK